MGSKSESSTNATPVNQQLTGQSTAQAIFADQGNIRLTNLMTDFGSVQAGANVARLGINAATDTAASAMLNTSAVSLSALENMTKSAQAASYASKAASDAAALSAMKSAEITAANSRDYMASASALTNNVLARTQDQLTGVLNSVKSNSLAMTSAGELTAGATADMTQKLLIAAGIVGAVIVLRG
jgi:hypothetical protein